MASSGPSRAGAVVVALGLVLGGVVIGAVATLFVAFVGAVVLPVPALLAAAVLAAAEVGYAAVAYLFLRTETGEGLTVVWRDPTASALSGVGLALSATAALVFVNRLAFALAGRIGLRVTSQVQPPDIGGSGVFVFLVPVLLFVVAPAEEYLFRGVIQRYFRRAFSARGALLAAAVVFTLVHLPNLVVAPGTAAVSVPLWLVLGLAFGWLYDRTGTLAVPTAVHGLYNVVVLGLETL